MGYGVVVCYRCWFVVSAGVVVRCVLFVFFRCRCVLLIVRGLLFVAVVC